MRRAIKIFCLFIFLGGVISAAANVAIYPTSITLSSQNLVGTFTLSNHSDDETAAAINIDAQLRTWNQVAGKDVLSPHGDEIILMPPMFSIGSNGIQTVRVASMLEQKPSSVERCYRVTFKEFTPQVMKAITNSNINMSFLFLMNFSVPVFIEPTEPKPLAATFTSASLHQGILPIHISNTGNVHIHVLGLKVLEDDNIVATSNAVLYVLPGKTMTYDIKLDTNHLKAGHAFDIVAQTDNKSTPELKGALEFKQI